jgi:hypothetical protein
MGIRQMLKDFSEICNFGTFFSVTKVVVSLMCFLGASVTIGEPAHLEPVQSSMIPTSNKKNVTKLQNYSLQVHERPKKLNYKIKTMKTTPGVFLSSFWCARRLLLVVPLTSFNGTGLALEGVT